MSVERIAPLAQATTDPTAMRIVSGPGAGPHGRATPPFPPTPQPVEGAPHLFDTLVLPLPEGAAAEERQFPSSLVNASYRTQAARGRIEQLVDGHLPAAVIRREVETLLRRVAAAREIGVAQLIEGTPETAPERLPSRNAEDAHFDFRGRLAAADEDGKLRLFDLYLTRASAGQWEAALFLRDPTRASQTFPRTAPALEVSRLVIDPATGLTLACVAQHFWRGVSLPAPLPAAAGALQWTALLLFAAALSLLVLRVAPWPAAALLLAALAVLIRLAR